ncbi:hypothetical protein F5Y00DRAFT_270758 [Daldinia vernicosa]|uniref:uncharacterized protein n=1 Tax=Daldinia vernicosa TaxID=114800 RepID=UPI0020073BF5|nr:uncharacterized protein F5Y00DRAFT_270758 [Daldinia vernicosa]KAI0853595.1 hypothetical protein F5Y00DRAFT_270758 [Daldinia vernicosa]
MRLSILVSTAFVAALNASAIPNNISFAYENRTLEKTGSPEFDCRGSIMCSTVKVRDCDEGVNYKIIRNDDLNYGAVGSGKPHLGTCHGVGTDFGCAILIQGPPSCVRSGNDIWWDYQDIRKHGCHHCGHKRWGKGCSTTIDYEPSCDRVR